MKCKWWTLLAGCIAIYMLLLDVTIVNVALPSIERSLGASFSDLQWVIDAYAKFIEADFLGSQRLNPKTDGRPDPRPDVREDAPQLGALIKEFNFSQAPRKPALLPVHPKTDLISR